MLEFLDSLPENFWPFMGLAFGTAGLFYFAIAMLLNDNPRTRE